MSDPIDRTLEQLNAGHAVIVPVNELARLRRIEDAYRKDNLPVDGHKEEQWCERCEKWCKLHATLIHTATCDVAAHLGLPREKGEGE